MGIEFMRIFYGHRLKNRTGGAFALKSEITILFPILLVIWILYTADAKSTTSSQAGLDLDINSKIQFGYHRDFSFEKYPTELLQFYQADRKLFNSYDEYHVENVKNLQESVETIQRIKDVMFPYSSLRHLIPWPPEVKLYYIPTRDKISLGTVIINPYPYDKKKPTVFVRSPYGPSSTQLLDPFALSGKFAVVMQFHRGTFISSGNFSFFRHDEDDAFDTLSYFDSENKVFSFWNGICFSAGVSADGISALSQLSKFQSLHWVKGMLVGWATADAHDTVFPGGAFREGLIGGWLGLISATTDAYSIEHTLGDIKKHESDSRYYEKIDSDQALEKAHFPTVQFAGWWDIFSRNQIRLFNNLRERSLPEVRDLHSLVVGPLGHCALKRIVRGKWHHIWLQEEVFAWKAAYLASIKLFDKLAFNDDFGKETLGFVDQMLVSSDTIERVKQFKRYNLFVMGLEPQEEELTIANDNPFDTISDSNIWNLHRFQFPWPWHRHKSEDYNFWSAFDEWPEVSPQPFYLSSGQRLVTSSDHVLEGSEGFLYQPENPALTVGGDNLLLDVFGFKCGSVDQSILEQRDDYLSFTSAIFTAPMPICGEINATLYVSSDANDTDFIGVLSDVYLDNDGIERSMLLTKGIINMKWRESRIKPLPIEANVIYKVNIELGFTCYVVAKGHRVRFSVTSSSWPYFRVSKNFVSKVAEEFLSSEELQNEEYITDPKWKEYSDIDEQDESSGQLAKNKIYFSASDYPSNINLPVAKLQDLKDHKIN